MLRKLFRDLGKRELALRVIVLLGLAGMGCILLSSLLPEKAPEQAPENISAEEYRQSLEKQLTEILSAMDGTGQVRVLVTLAGGEEYRYAKADDRTVSDKQTRSSESYVTVGGSREALLEMVAHPAVTGVVVACEGGASPVVQEGVCRAVCVACGLPSNRVFVTRLASDAGSFAP